MAFGESCSLKHQQKTRTCNQLLQKLFFASFTSTPLPTPSANLPYVLNLIRISTSTKPHFNLSPSIPTMAHQPSPTDPHRQLRLISIFAFIPAVAFLLPCGLISSRELPAIGLAPMFCSSSFQLITFGSRPRALKMTVFMNALLAAFLLGMLIPRCVNARLSSPLVVNLFRMLT